MENSFFYVLKEKIARERERERKDSENMCVIKKWNIVWYDVVGSIHK